MFLRQALSRHQRPLIYGGIALLTGTTVAAATTTNRKSSDITNKTGPFTTFTNTTTAMEAQSQHTTHNDAMVVRVGGNSNSKDNDSATATTAVASIDNNDNEGNNNAFGNGLAFPTLESLVRASRLTQTAILMALDYYPPFQFLNSGKKDNLGLDLSPEEIEQYNHWQKRVESLRKKLDKAQARYSDTEAVLHLSITDRVEAKKHEKQIMQKIALDLAEAEEELAKISGTSANGAKSAIHVQAATRMLNLCRQNKGVYIKVGQHMANLDYLIPQEYIDILSSLFDDTPRTSYQDVRQVVKEDLGAYPEDLFDNFEHEPIASASLAQVHIAYEKKTGRKLAVKVQHRGLRETATNDVMALVQVVRLADRLFDSFSYGWLADEIAPQLPKELDFVHEGHNADQAAKNLQGSKLDCVVPKVYWPLTSSRVLTMAFEEGFKATDLQAIEKAGLNKRDVAKLISSVFASQVFMSGFVHCDPHPANVLLRRNERTGKPQLVLVDHGLYRKLDRSFQLNYAMLWKSLMLADLPGIQQACSNLGVDNETYTLFAAMLTARPFDEIVERSKKKSLGNRSNKNNKQSSRNNKADEAVIRGYAQRFMVKIFDMLATLPRQMLLLLKMNDCLRHIDFTLGSPANTLLVSGRYASRALYKDALAQSNSWLDRWRAFWTYFRVEVRIFINDLGASWYLRNQV